MEKKAMIVWLSLWAVTMPLIHLRNSVAAGADEVVGRALFMGLLFLIPALIFGLLTWFLLKSVSKSLFNKKHVTPAISLVTWLVIFVFLFLIPLF